MTIPGKGIRAAVYCRVSLAVMGDTTKVEAQEEQCREVCRIRGWEVGDVFTDNSRSAWQRNRKRPGWDAMLEGIRSGRFGAVASYWGDRIVRQPRDLEDLLDLREGRDLLFASVVGQYDLNNPDHRMMMRWEVARACNESDTISRRVANHHDKRRAQGLVRPGGRGGRAYGFATDGVTVIEAEAAVIRGMAARILAGEGAGAAGRDASAGGARTPTGAEFSHGTVRKMLARPRYAGLMPDGESAAAWPAILDRETWELVRATLDGRAGAFTYATNARRWLLSGIARCSECGQPMQVKPSKGRGRQEYHSGYSCVTRGCGRAYRSAVHLDAYVEAAVVAYQASERHPAPRLAADPGHAAEWERLHRQRAEAEELLADPDGGAAAILARRIARIDERIAELRGLADASQRDRLREQYRDITLAEFRGLPLDVRRALVVATVTVTVLPASRRGPGFRTEDVRVLPVA